jgi:hypothetical protein
MSTMDNNVLYSLDVMGLKGCSIAQIVQLNKLKKLLHYAIIELQRLHYIILHNIF